MHDGSSSDEALRHDRAFLFGLERAVLEVPGVRGASARFDTDWQHDRRRVDVAFTTDSLPEPNLVAVAFAAEGYVHASGEPVRVGVECVNPVPTPLYCLKCCTQHVDTNIWAWRPHRTHRCEKCLHEWRPYNTFTRGARFDPPAPDSTAATVAASAAPLPTSASVVAALDRLTVRFETVEALLSGRLVRDTADDENIDVNELVRVVTLMTGRHAVVLTWQPRGTDDVEQIALSGPMPAGAEGHLLAESHAELIRAALVDIFCEPDGVDEPENESATTAPSTPAATVALADIVPMRAPGPRDEEGH